MHRPVNTFFDRRDENRAVLGIGTTSGGMRDTLGLLVTEVTAGGPAEKAGIEEGDRLVSVNGTELRLSAADAGDPEMRGLMARRLVRMVSKLKAGEIAAFGVSFDGKIRAVKVTTVKASELFKDDGFMHFGALGSGPNAIWFEHTGEKVSKALHDACARIGDLGNQMREFHIEVPGQGSGVEIYTPEMPGAPMDPLAPTAPMAPMTPMAPMAPMEPRHFMRILAPAAPKPPDAPAPPLTSQTI
jgi:membrane-associated protease RseP (regulator of RpoE activity)